MTEARSAYGETNPARSSAGTTRRRLAPAERTGAILDEALKLFAERPYPDVTMRDIARACGINPALIYHYFDGKESLFRSALSHVIAQLQTGFAEARASAADPRAEIMSWIEMHASIAPTVARMTKLMADRSALRDGATGARALIARFYAFEQALLEDCIRRGIASGLFREVAAARTARTISLQLDGIFYASSSRGDERIETDLADLRILVATLLDQQPAR